MKRKIWIWLAKAVMLWTMAAGCLTFSLFPAYGAQMAAEPETAETAAMAPASIGVEDGEYTINIELSGGTGRAEIFSPAELTVKDGLACARIEWSSSHYDYMIVEGEKYLPVNEEGNSVFEIPVPVFDEVVPVIADTTAMSVPHEIEYGLIFHSDGIENGNQAMGTAANSVLLVAAVCAVIVILVLLVFKRKRNASK